MKPIVYLSGTTDDLDIGKLIGKDLEDLKAIFEQQEAEEKIFLRTDETVNRKQMERRFDTKNPPFPKIFYFSGHGNVEYILLSGNDPVYMDTLGQLFGDKTIKDTLDIVFLNACLTDTIANYLFSNGVKCTIGCTDEVRPKLSNYISRLFFINFLSMGSIGAAFNQTKLGINNFPFKIYFNVSIRGSVPQEPLSSSAELWNNTHRIKNELNFYQLLAAELDTPSPDKVQKMQSEINKLNKRITQTQALLLQNEHGLRDLALGNKTLPMARLHRELDTLNQSSTYLLNALHELQ